ncbi:hypothetical protein DLJ53_23030 [Acuticoccus sediminis]|uniref:SH3 domain-containing protein n=1 Tax=Acuticoccus sediminis TaxID=2184697 RepID=A0A8B2NQY9_9HYPH|nr:hypothetical protein [Acuticoccus sediminis]RAH99403.1 hypothetical protein DLJ53_23030 [Acuticoccus sediminis]
MRITAAIVLALGGAVIASPAAATSGWGCYRPNVGPSDPLNVRASPTSSSAVVTAVDWNGEYIIALDAPNLANADLFQVHQAEFSVCTPSNLPLGARWCPVKLFGGDTTLAGWLKRRFVDHNECP